MARNMIGDSKLSIFTKLLLRQGDKVRVSYFPNQVFIVFSVKDEEVIIEKTERFSNQGATWIHTRYWYVPFSRIKEVIKDGEEF